MSLDAGGFDWDAGNASKCEKHGLTRVEIEQMLLLEPLIMADRSQHDEIRYNAVGQTLKGRHVFVVFTLRRRDGTRLLRPISARYMHDKEVKAYERHRATQAVPQLRE